jgi:trehalose-6-phosphatase
MSDLIRGSGAGTFPVYVGDDETDEDAFRAVRDAGLGIRVGSDERPSAAAARLASCEEVRAFLAAWLERVEHGAAAGGIA